MYNFKSNAELKTKHDVESWIPNIHYFSVATINGT